MILFLKLKSKKKKLWGVGRQTLVSSIVDLLGLLVSFVSCEKRVTCLTGVAFWFQIHVKLMSLFFATSLIFFWWFAVRFSALLSPPFLECCFCSFWFCRFALFFTAWTLVSLVLLPCIYLNWIVWCLLWVYVVFKARYWHTFVVLHLVQFYALFLDTRIISFCSLFPLTPLPPLLLADSCDHFLALHVFGLSFLHALNIFEVSLTAPFCSFLFGIFTCRRKQVWSCPPVPLRTTHCVPFAPPWLSTSRRNPSMSKLSVMTNLWHSVNICFFSCFVPATYTHKCVPTCSPCPPFGCFRVILTLHNPLHHSLPIRAPLCPSVSIHTCPHIFMIWGVILG